MTGPGAVAVVCAVDAERRWLAPLEGDGVTLWRTGIGAAAARRRAAAVVASAPSAVLSTGFCGALDPDLRVGEVVCADMVADLATGEEFPADAGLLAAAPGRRGRLVTSPRLVRTPGERAAIAGLACDMESAHLARAAAAAGIPFLAVRAVTDETRHVLPDFDRLTDAAGEITPAFALLRVAMRPADIPRLMRLGPASRRAGRALAAAVAATLGAAA